MLLIWRSIKIAFRSLGQVINNKYIFLWMNSLFISVMAPKGTAAALAPFFAPAILFGVQRLDIKSKPASVLLKLCNFAFLSAVQFASACLYKTGLKYFRGNLSEANHVDENYTLTFFTMAHKVIAMFMTSVVMFDNIFSVGKFARHFECMDDVARRLNCAPAYFQKVSAASKQMAVALFLGYTAIYLFEFGAWVSNKRDAINLIHIFVVTDIWMIQEWEFILVVYATRCMYTQVLHGLKVNYNYHLHFSLQEINLKKICFQMCKFQAKISRFRIFKNSSFWQK